MIKTMGEYHDLYLVSDMLLLLKYFMDWLQSVN